MTGAKQAALRPLIGQQVAIEGRGFQRGLKFTVLEIDEKCETIRLIRESCPVAHPFWITMDGLTIAPV